MNDLVRQLEDEMRKLPQLQLETKHYFADGMYCRALFRPAGTLIVGKQHRREHFYIVVSGRVQVEKNIYGPGSIVVSGPGSKRAVLALEDSLCITVHRTNKKNLDKIERELIEPDPRALFDARNKLKELPCPG